MQIFAVRDTAVEAFLAPFYMPSKGAAIRAFGDTVNDPQSGFNKHPQDFSLYFLGDFDEQTGIIAPASSPEHCVTGADVMHNPYNGENENAS